MRNFKIIIIVLYLFSTAAIAGGMLGGGIPSLSFFGDSLTAGTGATSTATTYPYLVANSGVRGRWYWSGGVGSQTSTQIAARQGGVPTTATISGGQIPASGGVTVTFVAGTEPITVQGPNGVYGTISSVYGLLTLSAGTYTFTRQTVGGIVVVSSALFVPDVSFTANGFQSIWAGRNNYSDGSTVQSDIAAMVATITGGRYLVLSILTSSTDGASNVAIINTLNSALSSTYGSKYLDVLGPLVAQGCPGGSYLDPTACAGGYPPSGLRFDAIHLNDAGYAIVAQLVYAKMQTFGWAANDNYLLEKAA